MITGDRLHSPQGAHSPHLAAASQRNRFSVYFNEIAPTFKYFVYNNLIGRAKKHTILINETPTDLNDPATKRKILDLHAKIASLNGSEDKWSKRLSVCDIYFLLHVLKLHFKKPSSSSNSAKDLVLFLENSNLLNKRICDGPNFDGDLFGQAAEELRAQLSRTGTRLPLSWRKEVRAVLSNTLLIPDYYPCPKHILSAKQLQQLPDLFKAFRGNLAFIPKIHLELLETLMEVGHLTEQCTGKWPSVMIEGFEIENWHDLWKSLSKQCPPLMNFVRVINESGGIENLLQKLRNRQLTLKEWNVLSAVVLHHPATIPQSEMIRKLHPRTTFSEIPQLAALKEAMLAYKLPRVFKEGAVAIDCKGFIQILQNAPKDPDTWTAADRNQYHQTLLTLSTLTEPDCLEFIQEAPFSDIRELWTILKPFVPYMQQLQQQRIWVEKNKHHAHPIWNPKIDGITFTYRQEEDDKKTILIGLTSDKDSVDQVFFEWVAKIFNDREAFDALVGYVDNKHLLAIGLTDLESSILPRDFSSEIDQFNLLFEFIQENGGIGKALEKVVSGKLDWNDPFVYEICAKMIKDIDREFLGEHGKKLFDLCKSVTEKVCHLKSIIQKKVNTLLVEQSKGRIEKAKESRLTLSEYEIVRKHAQLPNLFTAEEHSLCEKLLENFRQDESSFMHLVFYDSKKFLLKTAFLPQSMKEKFREIFGRYLVPYCHTCIKTDLKGEIKIVGLAEHKYTKLSSPMREFKYKEYAMNPAVFAPNSQNGKETDEFVRLFNINLRWTLEFEQTIILEKNYLNNIIKRMLVSPFKKNTPLAAIRFKPEMFCSEYCLVAIIRATRLAYAEMVQDAIDPKFSVPQDLEFFGLPRNPDAISPAAAREYLFKKGFLQKIPKKAHFRDFLTY